MKAIPIKITALSAALVAFAGLSHAQVASEVLNVPLAPPSLAGITGLGTGVATALGNGLSTAGGLASASGVSPLSYGAICNGNVANASVDTAGIQAAINTQNTVVLPGMNYKCILNNTITFSTPNQEINLNSTQISLYVTGTPTPFPLFELLPAATGAVLENSGVIDGGYSQFATSAPNAATGSCIVDEANQSRISNLWLQNCWDNGVFVGMLDGSRANPKSPTVSNIRSYHNGYGDQTGSAVDFGSAQNFVASDISDVQSEQGFEVDVGAGAIGVANNISSQSPNTYCAYLGSNVYLTNFFCIFPGANYGVWLDGTVNEATIDSCDIEDPPKNGLLIKGGASNISVDCSVNNAGSSSTGTYSSYVLDLSSGNINNLNLTVDAHNTGTLTAKYGLDVINAGSNTVNGIATVLNSEGTSAAYSGVPAGLKLLPGALASIVPGVGVVSTLENPIDANGGVATYNGLSTSPPCIGCTTPNNADFTEVAIGRTSPATTLDVAGTSSVYAGNIANGISFIRAAGTTQGLLTGIYSTGSYATSYAWLQSGLWYTAASALVLQPQSGNVGIGTTSPQATLDVGGAFTGGAQPIEIRATNATGNSDFRLGQDSTHNGYFNWVYNATAANAYVAFGDYGGNNPLVFFPTESAGNVAIGATTSPGSRLVVKGLTSDNTASGLNIINSGNTSLLYVRNDGNVGIGTTSPSELLQVAGSVVIGANNTGGGVFMPGNLGSTFTTAAAPDYSFAYNSNAGIFHPANDIIGFSTAGTERMRITNTGNVGIGTASPSQKLDVNGNVEIEGFAGTGSRPVCVTSAGTLEVGSLSAGLVTCP